MTGRGAFRFAPLPFIMNEKNSPETSSDFLSKLGLGKASSGASRESEIEAAFQTENVAPDPGHGGGETEREEPDQPAVEGGRRGRKRKWLRVPVDQLDRAALAALPADLVAGAGLSVPPVEDDTEIREMVGATKDIANEIVSTVVCLVGERRGHPKEYCRTVGDAARMPPRVDALITSGAVGTCKKHRVKFSFVSEAALIMGGILWVAAIGAAVRAIPALKTPPVAPERNSEGNE